MKGDKGTKHSLIDFTELDANLEVLVLSIGEFFSKKNSNLVKKTQTPRQEKPRIRKKLNVELIKQMILETKEMQEKARKNTNQAQMLNQGKGDEK